MSPVAWRTGRGETEWGEWGRYSHENVLKPKSAFYFWLNPITKRASWAEPNWEVAYRQRIERSEFVGEKQGWEQYWDPRFECNFFYNVMDGRLTCVDPVAGACEEEGDAPKTLAALEAEQNAPPPEPEPEPDGPMRALTAEEEAGDDGADAPEERPAPGRSRTRRCVRGYDVACVFTHIPLDRNVAYW